MKELIIQFIDQYVLWGLMITALLAIFFLAGIHRRLGRLNRSLGMVTGNIQEYFNVIMTEETELLEDSASEPQHRTASSGESERGKASDREMRRGERFLTNEEREILTSRRRQQSPEDEEVFNSVMQEFFP